MSGDVLASVPIPPADDVAAACAALDQVASMIEQITAEEAAGLRRVATWLLAVVAVMDRAKR